MGRAADELRAYRAKLSALVADGMKGPIRGAVGELSRSMQAKAKMNAGPPRMQVRSGNLRESIATRLEETRDGWTITLRAGGPQVPYASAHEFGETIRPKGRYLAIPFGRAVGPDGELRAEFRGRRLEGIDKLFVFRSGSKLFLGWREGGALQAGWRLSPNPIQIREKRYLRDAAEDTRRRAKDVLVDHLLEAMKVGG